MTEAPIDVAKSKSDFENAPPRYAVVLLLMIVILAGFAGAMTFVAAIEIDREFAQNYYKTLSYISVLQIVTIPLLGTLSDIFGRKSLIRISLTGLVIQFLIFAYMPESLYWGVFIAAATSAGLIMYSIYGAELISTKHRATLLVGIVAAWSVGYLAGNYAVIEVGVRTAEVLSFIAIFVVAVAMLITQLALPELLYRTHNHPSSFKEAISGVNVLFNREILFLVLAFLFCHVGERAFAVVQTEILMAHRGDSMGTSDMAYVIAASQSGVVLQLLFAFALIGIANRHVTLIAAFIISIVGIVLFAITPNDLLIVVAIFSLFTNLVNAILLSLIADRVSQNRYGVVFGVLGGLGIVAGWVGTPNNFLFRVLQQTTGHVLLAVVFPAAMLLTGLLVYLTSEKDRLLRKIPE